MKNHPIVMDPITCSQRNPRHAHSYSVTSRADSASTGECCSRTSASLTAKAANSPRLRTSWCAGTRSKSPPQPIPTDRRADTVIIDGAGRTLMPGLIDAHTHIMFATVPQMVVLTSDIGFINVAAVKAANDMLMRGFTSIRDLGGPVFGLKRGIDAGLVPGPRIWPCGRLHLADRRPWRLPPAERAAGAARATSPTASASARRPSPTALIWCASARANNWRWARRRSS